MPLAGFDRMTEETQNKPEANLQALGRAVASFFVSRESGDQTDILRELCERLVRETGRGNSHLILEQYADLCQIPLEFSAVGRPEEGQPIVLTEWGGLYFRRFYEYELEVAGALSVRANRGPRAISPDTMAFFEQTVRGHLDPSQCLAVGVGLQRDLFLLTGGPGSGKTRTLVVLLACLLLEEPDLSVALSAPTGKAANRLRLAMGRAMEEIALPEPLHERLLDQVWVGTVHRLLGPIPGSVEFRRNVHNPLSQNLVVVDEASMVDLPLMGKLLSSLQEGARLILAGDADQLSPVQGGAVFHSLCTSLSPNQFPPEQLANLSPFSSDGIQAGNEDILPGCLVRLTRSHRYGLDSKADEIGSLCTAIREGRAEDALGLIRSSAGSLRLIESIDDPSVSEILRSGFAGLADARNPGEAIDRLGDFRILCAHNHGRFGVEEWNHRVERIFPPGKERPSPVVIGSNDYSVGLFNGDDGVTLGNRAFFSGPSALREFSRSRLPTHLPGHALSIHRSQGSEFNEVLVVLPPADTRILSLELLYVAVSRARVGVTLVGDSTSLIAALERNQVTNSGVVDFCRKS